MFTEKAVDLLKELDRCPDTLPPYHEKMVRAVLDEMNILFEKNVEVLNSSVSDNLGEFMPVLKFRHAALERNKRCLMAYFWNRLLKIRQMRWEFGRILPPDVKSNLSEAEVNWFNNYSKILANYMKSIGQGCGLNLLQNMDPPKSLYLEVRCLADHGEIKMENGEVICLQKNHLYLLPRSACEMLIRQGILEQVVSF
ncbi:unnamed protein product [Bemisia tabaci]|uniref:DNA replication complex GINS protein PSF1 n=1 Tax=Bemisia tabaci TaxID=7038 RepID=A0A9P0F7H7_BEMTA|nr:PREDICTED: DNA replication complex GINS protein PSF1-like [Bemisia tabaci]CAH0392911.1 unnamed protein product [Bemisia tabaci]